MNYLKEVGITDEEFNEIRTFNGDSTLENLFVRKDEALKTIKYLQDNHINNIADILKYVIDVFFKDYEEVKEKFESFGLEDAVNNINNDFFFIENVVFD